MRTLYLSDIHGNFNLINQYINQFDIKNANIIQLGDFGIGFNTLDKEKRMLEQLHIRLLKNNVFVYVLRGNHDNPNYFENNPFNFTNIKLMPDYTILNLEDKNILFLGGAVSVDRTSRYTKAQLVGDFKTLTGRECWWPNEEFVFDKDKLEKIKNIDVVVTHTCPDFCPPDNTNGFGPFIEKIVRDTRNEQLKKDILQERFLMKEAFNILKKNNDIKNHYYGHFHKNDFVEIDGIKHRLINENELWEERV